MNDEFVKAGAGILVILGDTLERARKYAETLKTPFPVLADRGVRSIIALNSKRTSSGFNAPPPSSWIGMASLGTSSVP
jgi:peroxiredoxin